MCGIAGIVSSSGFDPEILTSMTHLVKHRGPDGFGIVYFDDASQAAESFHDTNAGPSFARPRIGLGARRLAILDLSRVGNQPMQIDDGRFWIAYNGEIYNYLELRRELRSLGHRFRTNTDTEVILHAYQQWGASCVSHFRGMWAFAIHDCRNGVLFCSRDRFGIKPFYYFASPSLFLFGSEIKQILEHPEIPRRVNEAVALQYLTQGVQDHSELTFFERIRQLPAAHNLHIDLRREPLSIRIDKYWDLPVDAPDGRSEKFYVERFAELFADSIEKHLRSDVPVGSCLSGGLDSSSIVAVASREAPGSHLHSFSSCFEAEVLDERPFIRAIVDATDIAPSLVFPRAENFWDDLDRVIWHQDEPFGSTSVYAQWCVMRAARQAGVPVLLDGQGGDEILCGYRKFYPFHLWHMFRQAKAKVVSEGIAWLRGNGRHNWSWKHARRYLPVASQRESAASLVCDSEAIERNKVALPVHIGAGESLQQRQKDDLTRYSLPALLHYEDRSSMAHSIESRVPMLDHELATFAVNCPPELKLRDGWTKWILREAMKGTLPESVRLRKTKLGFETPQSDWLRQDTSRKIANLCDSELKMGRILSREKVHSEFRKFRANERGRMNELEVFRVLNLELWARVFNVS
jgi:asparagine synthase (glutamine-hydrolysing)